jgi:uncharacterized protein YaiE (UPF0345 family)
MEFNNVKLIKKSNIYFDGKVTSRTVYLQNGERKTLGFMLPGEYEFNTAAQEIMEVLGGEMHIMLKGKHHILHIKRDKVLAFLQTRLLS